MTRIRAVVLAVCIAVFLGGAGYLGWYFYRDYKIESDVSSLRKIMREDTETQTQETNEDAAPAAGDADTATQPPQQQEPEYAANGMLASYYKLWQINNDMVGWVTIPDTKVDYPVMYNNQDNEYYLHKNFDKEYSANGLPYLDYQCDLSKPSTNLIIYGHHMRSGAMFASLTKYTEKSYLNAHPSIEFDTLYEKGMYEIFAVFTTVVGSDDEIKYNEFIDPVDETEFNSFISQVMENSCYDTGKTAHYGDRLLTLSTCSYDEKNQRTAVMAKRIQ